MAKKRDLLDADYNPVAEQIRRYKRSVSEPATSSLVEAEPSAAPLETPPLTHASTPARPPAPAALPPEPPREVHLEAPAGRADEAQPWRASPASVPTSVSQAAPPFSMPSRPPPPEQMPWTQEEAFDESSEPPSRSDVLNTSLRTRVSRDEHKHWLDVCLHITGKQNQFSALVRALLILVENSQDELEKRLPELHRMRVPQRTDRLANTLYEYRLAEILYDAIATTGRPKPKIARKDRGPDPGRDGRGGYPGR